MILTRPVAWLLGSFALLSLIYLLGYFGALTDLWHMLGRPGKWSGAEAGNAEWRFLAIGFWPMLGFHILWLVVTLRGLTRPRPAQG
jgi:hypothetical protein